MKLSTKIFLIVFVVSQIAAIVFWRYVFDAIILTETGIDFTFSTLSILGLVFMGLAFIFGMVCFNKFLRTQKLSRALFFSVVPTTILYGVIVYLVSDLTVLPSKAAKVLSTALNVSTENDYNSILWAVVFTLVYIVVLFLTFLFFCRPVQKIEKITEKLGDGRLNENKIFVGKSNQFKKIETSLKRINYNYQEKENRVKSINLEAQKFVPKQFLKFLGKGSIQELEIGNKVQKRGTTLFCDLVSLTKAGKTLSLEDNFNFVNSYLNIISPIVRKFDGFVDKCVGEGLLAVFPRPERAIECAHLIARTIEAKNKAGKGVGIEAKISINTGEIMFGIVGEEDRKSPSVISDVVNLAQKMQEVNKMMGTEIIFSKQTLNEIPEKFNFYYRYIGSLVLENTQVVGLFESLESKPREKREKLFRLKNKFEEGVRLYNSGDFKKARKEFEEILRYVPEDRPSYVYFNKSSEKLLSPSA